METVNFPCSHCGELMAVTTDHLGAQVHCPHCRQVVQAPSAPESRRASETESILTSADEVSDDLFGGPLRPRVELPAVAVPDVERTHISPSSGPAVPDAPLSGALPSASSTSMPVTIKPPRLAPPSNVGAILLIFLIPYAIVTTLFIAWLLYNQKKQTLDYERMFDPNPKDGGPRLQLKHDLPLPARLKVPLNKAIHVGALEVTPLGVRLTHTGDLVLSLQMRNASKQVSFNPCPASFVEFDTRVMRDWRPYTFLEGGARPVYGATLQWFRGSGEVELDLLSSGVLRPGETKQLELTTTQPYQKTVQASLRGSGPLLWRVHVRRGDFIEVGDRQFSTTAVIGVEFSPASVVKRG
jgi:hypothetical protein